MAAGKVNFNNCNLQHRGSEVPANCQIRDAPVHSFLYLVITQLTCLQTSQTTNIKITIYSHHYSYVANHLQVLTFQ